MQGKRNLFILGNQIFVSLIYKKTMQKSVNFDPIVRFLPANVSTLLFSYVTLMRPLYDVLCFYDDDNHSSSPVLSFSDVETFRKSFKEPFTKGLGA
jgi:hypothetical protein